MRMTSTRQTVELKIDVPWGHIAGKTWGSPDATRVLVVHGSLDNAGSFDRIIPMLPENFYYVVIDLPGHGLSSHMPEGLQLDFLNYVFAVRLVLDHLKWESCMYVGHSFGAQLGVFHSILNPGVISKLVCLDGFIPNPVRSGELVKSIRDMQNIAVTAYNANSPPLYTKDEILYALKSRRNFPLNSKAAEALFPRATTRVGELYKYNRDLRLRTSLLPLLGIGQYVELIKHLKIPVLIVLAEASWFEERFYIESLETVVKNVGTNYSVVKVRGNHDVHNNDPERVAPHVSAFLNDAGKSKL